MGMGNNFNTIRSKLARIFLVIFLLVTFSFAISYIYTKQGNYQQEKNRLYQSQDSLEYALNQKFKTIYTGLQTFVHLYINNGYKMNRPLQLVKASNHPMFEKIIFVNPAGEQIRIIGENEQLLPKYLLLEQINSTYGSRYFHDTQDNIYLRYTNQNNGKKRGLFIAQIRKSYLKKIFSSIPSINSTCLISADRQIVQCSENVGNELKYLFTSSELTDAFGPITKSYNTLGHLIYHRRLEITGHDYTADWSVSMAQPTLVKTAGFFFYSPWYFSAGLVFLMFISWLLIYRITAPLLKLTTESELYAKKSYNHVINIKSNDECSNLATVMNSMAQSLTKHMHALDTLSNIDKLAKKNTKTNQDKPLGEIDNLILSNLSKDNIISILLTRIQNIVNCEDATIIITDKHDIHQAHSYSHCNQSNKVISKDIRLSNELFDELQISKHYLFLDNQHCSAAMSPLINYDYYYQIVLPIIVPSDISVVMVFYYDKRPKIMNEELQQAHDIGHRVTAVLSNVESEGKLYHKAHYDALTNLPNRLLFHERLQQAIERGHRDKNHVALMFLDLDGFKALNDTHGHGAGDDFLKTIAKRLKSCVRAVDTVSRLGGDEFTIILPDLKPSSDLLDNIHSCAMKILNRSSQAYTVDSVEINVSVSIGIAIYPNNTDDLATLLKNADTAMYEAKASGKNCIRYYNSKNKVTQLMNRQQAAGVESQKKSERGEEQSEEPKNLKTPKA